MSAKWSGYFKVVQPRPETETISDNQDITGGGLYGNYAWYARFLQGSSTRLSRYKEYESMDQDVEVAIALDTIAEHMTENNDHTDLPLDLDMQVEEGQIVKTSVVMTLRTALRRWSEIHDWETKLFGIGRALCIYGDVFFEKIDDFSSWKYIHPSKVLAAIVDKDDVRKIVAWQTKAGVEKASSTGIGPYQPPTGSSSDGRTEIVPADKIVRFTLNDDMSDSAPFGDSVLRPVFRSHRQKMMLEDAILIYRVQRAPERRVYYIDVGKMPPQRVSQYLQQMKNEIRQKKIPSMQGGKDSIESVYNVQSMSEDFFFACLSMKSKVYLLDGRELTIEELEKEYKEGKENWTYTIDQKTHKLVPGKIGWAGVTRKNAELVRVHLDNGEYIDCTPDHKFVLRSGHEKQAKDLIEGQSLMPIYKKFIKTNKKQKTNSYEMILDNSSGKYKFTHLEISPKVVDKGTVIHHIDYNPKNNNPTNLVELTNEDHWKRHHSENGHVLGRLWEEDREKMLQGIRKYHDNLTEEQKDILSKRNKINGSNTWLNNQNQVLENLKQGREKFRNSFNNYEEYCDYMSNVSKIQWTEEKCHQRGIESKQFNSETKSYYVDDELFNMFVACYKESDNKSLPNIKSKLLNNDEFFYLFKDKNKSLIKHKAIKFSDKFIYKLVKHAGYDSYADFKLNYKFNHYVAKVESLPYREDTGCLYVVDPNENHNFALSVGVYVKNSRPDGRGSRVETLPGGQGLGELSDLEYFQNKVWRGLRVPLNWMKPSSDSLFNDDRVGTAYIEEIRFTKFVQRLQGFIGKVIDKEFKRYLQKCNIIIDETLFKVKMPAPTNFGSYRQQQMDSELLNTLTSASGIEYLSKRFALQRYGQITDDDIITNERLKMQEMGMDPDNPPADYLLKIYGMSGGDMSVAGAGGVATGGVPMGGMIAGGGEEVPPGGEGTPAAGEKTTTPPGPEVVG